MMRSLYPIGVSDFKNLVTHKNPTGEQYFFVDKSLFIKEVLSNSAAVSIIIRPRRFGKTSNLSMLKYFLDIAATPKEQKLFADLNISNNPDFMQQQAKFPVIFLTLKDIKTNSYEEAIERIKLLITDLYGQFFHILDSDKILPHDKDKFNNILQKQANLSEYKNSLLLLSKLLETHYGEKVVVLIDEYDTPIQRSYVKGFYKELINFMQSFLSPCLKDNQYLYKAVLTGILRVSKENLFSDLNNVKIYSVLSTEYAEQFGFTQQEVIDILANAGLEDKLATVSSWYNGYNFGGKVIYNPWSIINFADSQGITKHYWVNTSSNDLIRKILINANPKVKDKIAILMSGQTITEVIDEHVIFKELEKRRSAIWSLFLMSGYLKAVNVKYDDIYGTTCELQIPNLEINFTYSYIYREWLTQEKGISWYKELLENLTSGKIDEFCEKLQEVLDNMASYHDTPKKSQELFYHGLMLGLVAGLKDDYTIRSNRESGKGRYDLAIIPNDNSKLGILMEFKAVIDKDDCDDDVLLGILEQEANKALKQIDKLEYIREFKQQQIANICKIGIAFSGRKVCCEYNNLLD